MNWTQAMRWAGEEYRRKNGRRQRITGYWNQFSGQWVYTVRNAQRGRPCRHDISKEPRR